MPIRQIDRVGDKVIQKVTNQKGEFVKMQVGIPGDSTSFKEAKTLTEARQIAGWQEKAR